MRDVVDRLDHLVLTVADVARTVGFYERVLGMERQEFDGGRVALRFGRSKINLHEAGREIRPHATTPAPGSADLCFVTLHPLEHVLATLEGLDVPVLAGPVARTGALGPIRSLYLRDPDGNLLEIASYEWAGDARGR